MLSERCVAARRVGAGWPSVRYVMGVLDLCNGVSKCKERVADGLHTCV